MQPGVIILTFTGIIGDLFTLTLLGLLGVFLAMDIDCEWHGVGLAAGLGTIQGLAGL